MTFHDKSNFNPKKGYYTCEYCKYYSTNTGKMKQHEVLHTQEWEALIEAVATAEVDSQDDDEKTHEVEMINEMKSQDVSQIDIKNNEVNELFQSIAQLKELEDSIKVDEKSVEIKTNAIDTSD